MPKDIFNYRKKQQLVKIDKSSKGNWDEKVISLCSKINCSKDYYTTSSCSGRIVLIKGSKIKSKDLFLFVSHSKISLNQLKKNISNIKGKGLIYFKQDPVILHIACKDLESAQKLIDFANNCAGWKRCGIITTNKRFVVELGGTEKMEFPFFYDGKILVDDDFLKILIKLSNKNLELGWEKISKLENYF